MNQAPAELPDALGSVILGTTGICNASCVHCPTGKAATAHVPRSVMPMELFRKIVDGIADLDITINGVFGFGLFGDGLVDPLVIERAEYLRSRLPSAQLWVNTNAAAFHTQKHARLTDLVTRISVHCESLVPETFEYLMQPLRAERVFPKYEQLLEAFPRKVSVSVPISKRNVSEFATMKAWFMDRGACDVTSTFLWSRCAEDRGEFESLALNPLLIQCRPEILDHLVVDCDGQVLICCNDFARAEAVGSLEKTDLAAALIDMRRLHARKIMAEHRHSELSTCSRCYADVLEFPQ